MTTIAQAVSDDISYIQSQNRGLQVQTQNQKALLTELEQLLVRIVISSVMFSLMFPGVFVAYRTYRSGVFDHLESRVSRETEWHPAS